MAPAGSQIFEERHRSAAVGHAPTEGDEQSNEGHITETIGHGLSVAQLNQPNHGNQRAQEPQPSDGQVTATAADQRQPGDQQQQEQ